MSVRVQKLECPNCGAPLGAPSEHGFSVCIYCTTTSHISVDGTAEVATDSKSSVSPAQMEEVRALLLSGKRDQAIARYSALSGVETKEAEEVVASMADRLSTSVLLSRPMNALGVVFVLALIAILGTSGWLAHSGALPHGVLYVTFALALFLYPFWMGLWRTLRYLVARSAPARVVHSVDVGPMKGGKAHIFKLLIEVVPAHEPSFKAEVVVPVRMTNFEHVQPGARVRARYFPGDTTRVLCERA